MTELFSNIISENSRYSESICKMENMKSNEMFCLANEFAVNLTKLLSLQFLKDC